MVFFFKSCTLFLTFDLQVALNFILKNVFVFSHDTNQNKILIHSI